MSRVAVTTRFVTGTTLSFWLLAGCHNAGNPVPTAPSPRVPNGEYTISGVVTDENGQSIANADVSAFIIIGNSGYGYGWFGPAPLHTDASGAYRMTSVPGSAPLWIQLNKQGYVQQCAVSIIISGDLTLNLALVSRANLTASPMPSAPDFRTLSGTVVQMTATGLQPVAGVKVIAGVDFPGFAPDENPAANTYSDATGRFALCGLSAIDPVGLEAGDGTREVFVSVAPGQTSDIQITLPSTLSNTMALRPGNGTTIH